MFMEHSLSRVCGRDLSYGEVGVPIPSARKGCVGGVGGR